MTERKIILTTICIIIIILLILICTLENFYRFICKGICRLESLSKWADRAIQWKQQVDALHIGARDLLHTPNIILVGVGINAIKLMGLYSIPYLCKFLFSFAVTFMHIPKILSTPIIALAPSRICMVCSDSILKISTP